MPRKTVIGSRPNEFKYGMGLYGAAWPLGDHFFVCGGGGHGLVNRIVWASFRGGRCSDQVGEYKLGTVTPRRMVLAPSGSALILGMNDGGVRRFQLDLSGPSPRLIEVSAAFTERFQCLQEEVDSMAFTPDGALLAVGFSTGDLKVLAYPTMKPLVHWKLESDVKDLDFAWQHGGGPQQGPLLATVCDKGTCQLWDVRSCSAVCQLQLPRGLERAKFSRCRFSRSAPILYVTMNLPRSGCHIAAYGPDPDAHKRRATSGGGGAAAPPTANGAGRGPPGAAGAAGAGGGPAWVLLKRHEVDPDFNSSLEISRSGRLLAMGQSEGALLIVDPRSLHVVKREPKASMAFVTRVVFSDDDARVLAVGGDANAFVLELRAHGGGGGGGGGGLFLSLLLLLLAAAAGAAFLLYAQPDRMRQAQELWEELQQHEAVRGGLQLLRRQAERVRPHVERHLEAARPHLTWVQSQVERLVRGERDEL